MPAASEQELVYLSQSVARDVLLVQGGGGNTSVKSADGRRMWIKASGLRLAEVGPGRGYLETDLPALLGVVRDEALAGFPRAQAHEESVRRIQQAVQGNGHLRPSLETTFHAVLGPAVLHTHPVYLNAFTCMEAGEAALADAWGEPLVWARYEPPGYALGREVDRAAREHQAAHDRLPACILLRNHGLIASGQTATEAVSGTLRLAAAARRYFGPLPEDACGTSRPPAPLQRWAQGLQRALERRPGHPRACVRVSRCNALLEAAHDPEHWLSGGPLVPDDVVYNGPRVYLAETSADPRRWLEGAMETPPDRMVVAVRGLGVALAGPSQRTVEAMEENLLAHVLIRWLIAIRRGRARPLPPEEVDYLAGMESEKYRQRVAAAKT